MLLSQVDRTARSVSVLKVFLFWLWLPKSVVKRQREDEALGTDRSYRFVQQVRHVAGNSFVQGGGPSILEKN